MLKLARDERLGISAGGEVDYELIRKHAFLAGPEGSLPGSGSPPPGMWPNEDMERASSANVDLGPLMIGEGDFGGAKVLATLEADEALEAERIRWISFLMPGERIIRSSLLKKRAHIFSTTHRRFLLTQIHRDMRTLSRLIYIDEAKMVYRGEVPWSAEIKTELKDATHFEVSTPRLNFQLEDPAGDASGWCEAINQLVSATPKSAMKPSHAEDCKVFNCF